MIVAKSMAVAMVERGLAKLACKPEAINLGAATRAGANCNGEQSLRNEPKHWDFRRRPPNGATHSRKIQASGNLED